MEEGQFEVVFQVNLPDGTTDYVTIFVDTYPNMTMNELDIAIHDAITEYVMSGVNETLSASGGEPATQSTGEYEYTIEGFDVGGEFFEF